MRELRRVFANRGLSKEGVNQMISGVQGLIKKAISFKETRCTIISDKPEALEAAKKTIIKHRKMLEAYTKTHPSFLYSLNPVAADDGPEVAKLMASASAKAGVGPMAAVAGVLADLAVEAMLSFEPKMAVVENGGEVSATSKTPVDVALLAGDSPLSGRVGFRVEKFPVGIATSSGVYGHALSFGEAEAVTVFSEKAGLADAAATAICNIVKGDPDQAIRKGLEKALSIEGVEGVLIIYKGKVALAGDIPKIISIVK
jgi:ApbE superfamily uncharacterized protein (UPF0280 family)